LRTLEKAAEGGGKGKVHTPGQLSKVLGHFHKSQRSAGHEKSKRKKKKKQRGRRGDNEMFYEENGEKKGGVLGKNLQ